MLLWTKGLYEGQREDYGKYFLLLIVLLIPASRDMALYCGLGDIDATWEVMKEQVVIGQGVCLSGIPYWSTDIGGFLTVDGYTPELFIRW